MNHERAINLSIYLSLFFERLCNTWTATSDLNRMAMTNCTAIFAADSGLCSAPTGLCLKSLENSTSTFFLPCGALKPVVCASSILLKMKSSLCLIQVLQFRFCFVFFLVCLTSEAPRLRACPTNLGLSGEVNALLQGRTNSQHIYLSHSSQLSLERLQHKKQAR